MKASQAAEAGGWGVSTPNIFSEGDIPPKISRRKKNNGEKKNKEK